MYTLTLRGVHYRHYIPIHNNNTTREQSRRQEPFAELQQ